MALRLPAALQDAAATRGRAPLRVQGSLPIDIRRSIFLLSTIVGHAYHWHMILPSDDNSTPEKKPGKRQPDKDPSVPQEPMFDADAETSEDLKWPPMDVWGNFADTGFEDSSLMSQDEWRELLKGELVSAVDDLENFPDPDTDFDPPDPPDLFSFYSELLAMRQELRKSQSDLTKKVTKAISTKANTSSSLAVQIGIIAGELRAAGNDALAERLLALLDKNS